LGIFVIIGLVRLVDAWLASTERVASLECTNWTGRAEDPAVTREAFALK